MEQNKDINQFDLPLAKRTYLDNPNSIFFKKLLIFSPFILLLFSYAALRLIKNIEQVPFDNFNFQTQKIHDHRILGHLPTMKFLGEIVLIELILSSRWYAWFFTKERDEAKRRIYLVLSGYRSNLQNEIFYSLKSFRKSRSCRKSQSLSTLGFRT